MAWSLYNKSEIGDSFLEKKKGIIVAIKSQRYLSTFCATAKLQSWLYLSLLLYLHISEVNELHERHKILLHNELCLIRDGLRS